MIEPIVASIDEENCSGCRICNTMCPYNAIEFDEAKEVEPRDHVAVQGLRHVRGRLPGGGDHRRHFNNEQIFAEIEGILWDACPRQRADGGTRQRRPLPQSPSSPSRRSVDAILPLNLN